MQLRVEPHRSVDVVSMNGRLDLVNANALKDTIRQRLAEQRVNIVIDLENVHFINSSGIGALISILRDVRLSGGRLTLCQMAPYLEEIFVLTGLTRVFDSYSTVEDAVASYIPLTQRTAANS